MNTMITTQMVRDYLALRGPKSLSELTGLMRVSAYYSNAIQASLLDLQAAGVVEYNNNTGKWVALTKIE